MKKNKKKYVIISIILIALIVALIVTYFVVFNKKTNNNEIDNNVTNYNSPYEIKDNTLQAFDLYFMQLENNKKNMVYSPLSIKYALSMLREGTIGSSNKELNNIISNYDIKTYDTTKNLSLANAFFIKNDYKKNIKDSFIKTLKEKYNAEIIYDSFENPDNINNWIKEKTLGLIPNILDDAKDNTYFLVNALGVDMDWKYVIQEAYTENDNLNVYNDGHRHYAGFGVSYAHENYFVGVDVINDDYYPVLPFDNNRLKVKSVEFASSINNYDIINELGETNIRKIVGEEYEKWLASGECGGSDETTEELLNRYIKELSKGYKDIGTSTDYKFYIDSDVKVFQKELKNYNGLELEYIALMPRKELLSDYIKNIDKDKISNYINDLKSIELNNFEKGKITKITGKLPLFEMTYDLDIKSDLEKLGVQSIFKEGYARLDKLSTNKSSYISTIKHRANFEFSNEGIKASAATVGGGAGDMSCEFDYLFDVPVVEIDMNFDKLFMFILEDKKTKEVWFMGTVYDPIIADYE